MAAKGKDLGREASECKIDAAKCKDFGRVRAAKDKDFVQMAANDKDLGQR